MKQSRKMSFVCAALVGAAALLGCGGGDDDTPVTITIAGPNAVTQWNEIAATTINLPPATTGTAEEQRPNISVDLATVQVAVYDAVMAIAGTHRPFAITPTAPAAGASPEAAVAAAAYGVLSGLFPSRGAAYQSAYDAYLATLPDGKAKTLGLAVGAEVAAGILALRAADGRMVTLAPYVAGAAPGQFRGTNPVGRPNPFIKPFVLTSNAQFRAPGPPALTSTAYAADVNETKALGSATSTTRTAEQTETARFHTEPPPNFWPRNMRNFAMTARSLPEQARLMAMIWVAQADAGNACFESKYFYQSWRPASAIVLDGDGNAATVADPAWAPVVPTPNHPEYPAAHSCVSAAMGEVLRSYYGTADVTFDMTSMVTGSSHHFTTTTALVDEVQIARIAGGMHFRTSTVEGEVLGRKVAQWIVANRFKPR